MKIIKTFILIAIWLTISGMSVDPYGSGCVPTDKSFGKLPTDDEMKEWDGWWCDIDGEECLRVSSDVTGRNEIFVDSFEESFLVYELRKAPIKYVKHTKTTAEELYKYDDFWFGFSLYAYSSEKNQFRCGQEIYFEEQGSKQKIYWGLIRKKGNELIIWDDQNAVNLYEAIECNEIPGDYDGKEFKILGSILNEDEMSLLAQSKFHMTHSWCPRIFVKVEELPENLELRDD